MLFVLEANWDGWVTLSPRRAGKKAEAARAESATTLTLVRCANGRQSHYPEAHDPAIHMLAPSNKTAKPRPGSSRQMASSSNWPAARVSRQERWESRIPSRRRKIIAARFRELKKSGCHDGTDGMTADVAGVAAAIAKEPRHRVDGAQFEPVAEHVARHVWPTAAVPAVIPQHCSLPHRRSAK